MVKRVTLLGATGSIGRATLDLIRSNPDDYEIVALTANQRCQDLIALAQEFRPQFVALADKSQAETFGAALKRLGLEYGVGEDAVCHAAGLDCDWTMAAIVGAAGLKPCLEAAKLGGAIALANKEALVCAGPLFLETCRAHGTQVLPVDSEHNAIAQAIGQNKMADVQRIILTASGGPFRTASLNEMGQASIDQALAHPTWSMGAKISIDSATMMNKGLEVIEACHLFDLPEHQVDVLVHPDSIVHGLVEYCDGSWLAQLGTPDMRTPIAHALAFPARMSVKSERLDLAKISQLRFEAHDDSRFPAIRLAREAFKGGGGLPAVFNSANEIAVAAFLAGEIGFLDIAEIVAKTLEKAQTNHVGNQVLSDFDIVFELDAYGRQEARNCVLHH